MTNENWYPTVIKAQTWKMSLDSREKQKLRNQWKHKNLLLISFQYSKVKSTVNRWFVSNVAGHLRTWILADIEMVPYNSLRITKGAQRKQGQEWYPVFRMETLKNATLPYRAEHNYLAHIQEYLPPGKT